MTAEVVEESRSDEGAEDAAREVPTTTGPVIGGLLLFAAAVPLGYLGDRFRRTFIVGVCSTLWAAFALLTVAPAVFGGLHG